MNQTLKLPLMKTRLLLLLLFAFSFGNAQVNVTEGFESGVAPVGWTSEGSITTTPTSGLACNGSYKLVSSFMPFSNPFSTIYTSGYTSNGNSISVSFNYRVNQYSGTGNVYLYYELNNSGTWVLLASSPVITTTCSPLSGTIASGVIPDGSSVRFRMQMNVPDRQAFFDDFSATQTGPAPTGALAEYSFDNTYANILGSAPFASNINTTFTTDRHNNANAAIYLTSMGNSLGTTATIPNLPYSNAPRTISLWVKLDSYDTGSFINPVFQYGTLSIDNMFGGSVEPGEATFYGYNNNFTVTTTNTLSTWYHYVYVYDGTTAKIYKDSILLGSQAKLWNTINDNNLFRIGAGFAGAGSFWGAIDDLKIYNYALEQADITSLYTNNTLSSSNFTQNNLEVALYPNPVRDILNIEIENDIQSIEIYNIQGQKVLSSNQKQINVADLATGMYMVRIQDIDNNIVTKKIVIK